MRRVAYDIVATGVLVSGLWMCASPSAQQNAVASDAAPASLRVSIEALGDSGVSGLVTIHKMGEGVHVEGQISGLPPSSEHGFHIHEIGDCSAADGKSAGGHFNPHQAAHGPLMGVSHVGDLGNVVADENGIAKISVMKKDAVFDGDQGINGRAVIVHEKADDLSSQPSGAAGPRIACGVIQAG